jgi:hypothetical protein
LRYHFVPLNEEGVEPKVEHLLFALEIKKIYKEIRY